MSKRTASPEILPPFKRLHTLREKCLPEHLSRLTFDDRLFDEIILVIFSYLSWIDLCTIQPVNRNWSRLSLDNQLWKALYIHEYGRSRLRGARGFIGRGDGREIKPLPGRAKSEGIKDWKWMFRISSNWRTGRCSIEQIETGPPSRLIPISETHLLLAGNVVVSASSLPSTLPTITLSSPQHPPHTLPCPSTRASSTTHITALALDQSPPNHAHNCRLACFMATGEFAIFSMDFKSPSSSSRSVIYVPTVRSLRTSPIVQAVYHHPLLVTLSQSFHLSLYDLSLDTVTHSQSLSSFTSHPPSSLVLSAPTTTTYKLVLAYATPVYPAHWTVGATELIISHSGSERFRVTSTRTTNAIDIPQGWVDEHKMRAVREQWGRKVARVADTQTDGKWLVLAPGQNMLPLEHAPGFSSHSSPLASPSPPSAYVSSSMHSASGLQLYRLHLPSSVSSSSVPKLTFVRTLHGQVGPVSTLALADGRCVSLGVNGSIWVWDLEAGTGTEVSGSVGEVVDDDESDAVVGDRDARVEAWRVMKARMTTGARGAVLFDDRRIVSSSGTRVEVRKFDI